MQGHNCRHDRPLFKLKKIKLTFFTYNGYKGLSMMYVSASPES